MRYLITICLLFLAFLHGSAATAPYSILVAGGKLSLVPLHALGEFLGAKVKLAADDPNAFSIAYGDVYGDFDATQPQAVIDDKETNMPVAPLRYDGEIFLPVHWLADTFGFTVGWQHAPVVKAPGSEKQLAFPIRVVLPEIGEQDGVPYGVRVNETAYLRLDALPAFVGAKWSQAAPGGKQTVTLNKHHVSITLTNLEGTIDRNDSWIFGVLPPVWYNNHLYVPARMLATALGLTLAPAAAENSFTLRNPASDVQVTFSIALRIAQITADFTGEGLVERAYATLARPGDSMPSLVWVTRGAHTIWQCALGSGMERCIVRLQARDLTGSGHPALLFGCCFVDSYVSAVGFTAYQWQPKTRTFRNLMTAVSEDGFLRYPASNHGDGGILFSAHGHSPMLIQYQTLEPFADSAHYQARCFRWNGREFHLAATSRTNASYAADDPTAVAKALNELHLAGIPLLRGVELEAVSSEQ